MQVSTADTPKTLRRSALRFFSGTLLSRLTGLFRDMAMAFSFGTAPSVALFFIAYRFAHLFRRVLGESAVNSAFIPLFEELRQKEQQQEAQFFTDLTASLLLILVLLICGGVVGLSFFNGQVAWLTRLMLPSLGFISLYALNSALLQCDNHYFTTAIAPAFFNLVWITAALLLKDMEPTQAMAYLALAIVFAAIAQWLVTVPKALSLLRKSTKWPQIFSPAVCRMGVPLSLGLVGIAAGQVNSALDPLFAVWADAEGPAYLFYAIRIQQLPLALFGIALSGALLPPLSRAVKRQESEKCSLLLQSAFHQSLGLMIPCTAALLVLGPHMLAFLFARGHFSVEALQQTTQCLLGYTMGLIPMTLVLIQAPACYAEGNYKVPSYSSLGSVCINIALNGIFVGIFGWGAASVAWATAISCWCNALFLSVYLQRRWGSRIFENLRELIGSLLLTIVTAACSWTMCAWSGFSSEAVQNGMWPTGIFSQAVLLLVLLLPFVPALLYALRQRLV